jgi:FtsP/CotA-like multicopper oxidase with cupredoxin domain
MLHIEASTIEIAPKRIVSAITYNGQFPGPLLRFKEGQAETVDVHNDTDIPEQLHWHGQMVSTDVDGAAEEGTPFIPAHGMPDQLYSAARRFPFLSHAQSRGS